LRWKQNSNYSDELLGKGYMQSYAYCEFIGPDGFYPGDDFLMGLLILGPGRLYKDHFHPAPELYWTLTGPALWRRGAEDFVTRPGGSTIWHAPNVVHATRTLEEPLLAVWIWTKDTAYPAKLVDV
jgi:quercetin dioxygenase-like cupin family protein